jgi:hypothetical protein
VVSTVTGGQKSALVTIGGVIQAKVCGNGSYAVPSASACPQGSLTFQLVYGGGHWRISSAPATLLLTTAQFQYDYQPLNLYFFDPSKTSYLVPDPVYVPLQATPASLMNGLVSDLITPPRDWLSGGATITAFPVGTVSLGDVTLDGGTATINLGGSIARSSAQVMQQVSAQLLWTLTGSGQGGGSPVQSIEILRNGTPWAPSDTQGNPVQHQASYAPPGGWGGSVFYYLDRAGNLLQRAGVQGQQPARIARIGAGYSQIAVSPDGRYLAALRAGSLYTGQVRGPLTKRAGSGYTTMSWDPNGDLWATTGDQIVMLRGDATQGPLGQPVQANVADSGGDSVQGLFAGLRVAPDGVRMAMIVGGSVINFGAIVFQTGAHPGQLTIKIELSPFSVAMTGSTTFSSVTWYGPDNVITLSEPGPILTEYPVNGGSSTVIPPQARIESISASGGNALIACLGNGSIIADLSLSGAWTSVGSGLSAAYRG